MSLSLYYSKMAASMWRKSGSRIQGNVVQFLRFSRLALASNHTKEYSDQTQSVVIPNKVKRDDLSVLRALSQTVSKDPTALPYVFIDDPYLLPKSAAERRRYLLAKESGRKSAQYVMNSKPEVFLGLQKDEPKIEAFYPPVDSAVSEVNEAAILERIGVRDMEGALQVHTQLIESGHHVSLEVNNILLDFLCYHGGHLPTDDSVLKKMLAPNTQKEEGEGDTASEIGEENGEGVVKSGKEENSNLKRWKNRYKLIQWKDGNPADKLFDSMEERDSRSYNSMIRGLVKHGAHSRAYTLYNEMQERGIQTDVHAYNALIEGSISIRDDYKERWSVMAQLMKQMDIEKVQPNLGTFNTLLDNLRIMGALGRKMGLKTVAEMKACGVEPSLGTYSLLLMIFYKDSLPPSDILYDIMDTIEGQEFSMRHPKDVEFFKNAMSVCLSLRDVELAYSVDLLLNTGENYKLAGDYTGQNVYYGKFFHLICLMDNAESMFEYYNKFVPSALIPSTIVYMDMLRSLETACAYDNIPQLWNDMCMYGHRYRQDVLETLIQVMATSSDASPEHKSQFCSVALDIISAAKESTSRADQIKFGSLTLEFIMSICLQAKELEASWRAMQYIEKKNKVPSIALLEDFIQLCVDEQDITKALGCVRLAVGSGLPGSVGLADSIRTNLKLNNQQRKLLEDIMIEEDML
ncbi:small ribosomal subunit protein mS39-like [Lytechinus pictus]|uniref:small ribosomal subunit protein mS39-like n=1 Tax=Lytechinus pictus TaxID=7653 RepID=UPI0030B9FEBE